MADQWLHDEDMGHGFLVPVVIAWIVWRERARLTAVPMKPTWWGFAVLAAAALLHFAAQLGAGLFAGSFALLLSMAGVTLALGGFRLLRALGFPLLLTLFMLPKLAIVYNEATLPLQLTASRLASGMLSLSGVAAIREGNVLDVGGHQILVAEACSGIRYLLPLGFVAVVFGYVADPKPWMRVALLAAAVPLAIVVNAMRVAGAAYWSALDSGTAHALWGWLLFLPCLAALPVAQRAFNAIYLRHHA
jgi:exosortase